MGRVSDFVLEYSLVVDISDAVLFLALDIAQVLEETHQFFISGKRSNGLAAATVYISSIIIDGMIESFNQKALAGVLCNESCGVATATLSRNAYGIVRELPMLDIGERHINYKPEFILKEAA